MAEQTNETVGVLCTNMTQTCLVLPPTSSPLYSESVAFMHFAMSGVALVCAVGFIWNVSMAKRIMMHLGSKEPSDRTSFYVAPFLCCVFCFCSLVHGLSCMPVSDSTTYVPGTHIGCECMAGRALQEARYALRSLVMPLLLLVAFEQSYVIHKRKTAKFCCIGFDRGHRLKNTDGLKCVSRILRYSMWFISTGLLVFNAVMNWRVIESTRKGSNEYLLKQKRFTTKSMLASTQPGDLVQYIVVVSFTLYFGLSLWNYGKNFSMKMTAMPCNRWMAMLFGSLQLMALSLLPETVTVFTADLSVVLYMLTMILLQREVLLDLTKLMDYDKNKAMGVTGDSLAGSLRSIESGVMPHELGKADGGALPSWALGDAMLDLRVQMRAQIYVEELANVKAYSNPLRGSNRLPDSTPSIKPKGEVGRGAIEMLKYMHAKNTQFRTKKVKQDEVVCSDDIAVSEGSMVKE